MFPSTDSPKNAVDMFPRTDTLKWHSFYPLKPCGDGGIDVKENKIIGYKSVEINGFGVLEEILKAIFLFR